MDIEIFAPLVAVQLSSDVEAKVKATIIGIEPELNGLSGRKLIVTSKRELADKGYYL